MGSFEPGRLWVVFCWLGRAEGELRRGGKGNDGLGGSSRVAFVRTRQSMGCSRGAGLEMILQCPSPLVAFFRSFTAAPIAKTKRVKGLLTIETPVF